MGLFKKVAKGRDDRGSFADHIFRDKNEERFREVSFGATKAKRFEGAAERVG